LVKPLKKRAENRFEILFLWLFTNLRKCSIAREQNALLRGFRGRQTESAAIRRALVDRVGQTSHMIGTSSFHVFVVYPWVQFLDRDPTTPVKVMQDCRIRWGTVESVDTEHATIVSQRLMFDGGVLTLGDPLAETVRWSKDGTSLAPPPAVGETVAAHWDWICGPLADADCAALAAATQATLDLVNTTRFVESQPR